MTAEHEAAIRTAVDGLVAAILATVTEAAPLSNAPDRLLSIDEAASALGIGRTACYQELTNGRLRSFKVGRRRLIPASAIDAYIDARIGEDPVAPSRFASSGRRTSAQARQWPAR